MMLEFLRKLCRRAGTSASAERSAAERAAAVQAPPRPQRFVTDPAEEKWLESVVANKRYVAFIDVLAYKTLVADPAIRPVTVHAQFLYDVWEAMLQAFRWMLDLSPDVEAILFSDSVYLSATEPHALVAAVGLLYMSAYSWFLGHPEKWLPWLRCGIGHGWIMIVHDPATARLAGEGRGAFRNPAGPALLQAVYLSELKEADGMRILVPQSIFDELRAPSTTPLNPTMALTLDKLIAPPDPAIAANLPQGSVVDLPWWRLVDELPTRVVLWREHEWQAGYGNIARARDHYEATLALLMRP